MSKSLQYIAIGSAVLVVAVFIWMKFPHDLFLSKKSAPREPMVGPPTTRPGLGQDSQGNPVSFIRTPMTYTQMRRRQLLNP